MSEQKLLRALHNNAEWCARIWRSHGLDFTSADGSLYCTEHVPDFYPNVVTIDRDTGTMVEHIADLRRAASTASFSVKDSFADLDLSARHFHRLFEAQWLFRAKSTAIQSVSNLNWNTADTEDDLANWESLWDERDGGAARIFLPDLLDDPAIEFWAGRDQGEIVAGFIANRSKSDVGLSNIFGSYPECIAHTARHYKEFDLVGYESGDEVAQAQELGFETVGKLAIWVAV